MISRRRFTAGVAIALTPLGARASAQEYKAQQAGTGARIGYTTLSPLTAAPESHAAFRDELRQLGYVEGRNLTIEHRWLEGKRELLPQVAAELAALGVGVIVVVDTDLAARVVAATAGVPVVVINGGDYVGTGLAASLAKPGGRVTGLAFLVADLIGKRLELLVAAVPGLRRVVVVLLKTSPPEFLAATQREIEQAAKRVPVNVSVAWVDDMADLERQITRMAAEKRSGLLLVEEPPWWPHRARIGELTIRHGVPAIYAMRGFAEAGVLMSYGSDILYFFRRAAHYVAKILQGAKPGDLPIEQPTKFELVINLKTAKALGLTIPPSLLGRADQVIE
jgi:putative tryptophan/tyrosine transport system substrate-binding protein